MPSTKQPGMPPPPPPPDRPDRLTEHLDIRVSSQMLAWLRRIAPLEQRSVSSLIRHWIERGIAAAIRRHRLDRDKT
jgi:hypothetical protein